MGSKKHKKESKKRKHRSRSRSPLDGEDRERKRHKKHKDRKKDRSPDVEEVPVDSHLEPRDNGVRSRSRSSSISISLREPRDTRARDEVFRDNSQDSERDASSATASSSGGAAQDSLSIDETNKLRAKLGLKPLETAEKPAEDGKIKDDLGEFYHKPAANLSQQRAADKLRERLQLRRERRQLEGRLRGALLADGDDDDDAAAWIARSRDLDKQKRDAAKRAAMLDELDAEFGVGALVAEEGREARERAYAPTQLRGLRVAHDLAALPDEHETVLTLADKDVLAEDNEDVLVNVNIVDNEKYKKNIEERKKARAGYRAYDEEEELAVALGKERSVLSKYDEEIDAGAAAKRGGFRIGDDAALEAQRLRELMRAERLAGGPDKRLESLQLPELRIASDYLDEQEIQTKFKKTKRKGKIRKKPKQEPIDVDEHEAGTAPLETDDTASSAQAGAGGGGGARDEDEAELDAELQAALARARRLRLAERAELFKVEEILKQTKEEPVTEETEESGGAAIVLDATAEFCRTLGDIPTYGLAGNRDHQAEIMELERSETETEMEAEAETSGAWSRVDPARERGGGAAAPGAAGLEAEPALGAGVAGALRLALSKGYLERAGAAPAPRPRPAPALAALAAHHYSIEDKTYGGEDDKHGRRERGGYSGPLSEFREKSNFRPSIKLEYVDDDGRPLCPKEAFRYLSHKFHGKGPGKNKQEKRIKKAVQEGLMKKMSSTDTPLGTLQMLQQKQRETHSAFVVLSGAKRDTNN